MQRIARLGAFLLFSLLLSHGAVAQWQWEKAEASSLGIDQVALEKITAEFFSKPYGNADYFLLVKEGKIISEKSQQNDYVAINKGQDTSSYRYNYYQPKWHPFYNNSELHTLQSITKAISSLVIGIAIDKGYIESVDVPVMPFYDDYDIGNIDNRKQQIKLKHLLTMQTGIDWNEHEFPYEDPRNVTLQMENSDSWIEFVLNRPMVAEPGTVFAYSSGVSMLLPIIIKKTTGEDFEQFAKKHLFKPLGITEYYWKRSPDGLADTEGGLYLKPRDLARIGQMMLNNGQWNDTKVVSEAWISESLTKKLDGAFGYWGFGYTWMLHEDFFFFSGYGGQYLIVSPKYNAVAVYNSWNIYGGVESMFSNYVRRVLPLLETP